MRNEYSANQALAASAAHAKADTLVSSMQERRRRAQEARFKKEVAESNSALLNVLMQTLGLIAVVAISYWLFISIWGN